MTGLNGKRKALESPLVKRPAQHKPQASRRTKRTKEPALPSKRQSSTARAPLPDDCDGSAPVSYSLRNRIVFVPKNTSKPIVPATSEPAPPESEFRKEPKYMPSKQTLTCAQMGLEHYNSMNQIRQRSLSFSGSCSSVFPSQLRMAKKKLEASTHTWNDAEEKALLQFAEILKMELSFQENKNEFCRRLAVMMNGHFQQLDHQYVPLDASRVKSKLVRFEGYWSAQSSASKKMYTSSGGEIIGHDKLWTELFSPSEATSSGAPSVSKKRKSREYTTPTDRKSALKYMIEHESSVAARNVFAAALASPNSVDVFLCLDGYLNRRKHLDLWKSGMVRVPEVEGIDPNLLPADFL